MIKSEFSYLVNLILKANLVEGITITPFFINLKKGTNESSFRI